MAATAEAPTRGPILLNARDVGIALDAAYPAALRAAGIGGIVVVRALVDTDGAVGKVEVRRSSGHPELDEAARSVARAMWFSPALRGGQPTRVWIQFPVAFQPR
ncbi:MAG: energy transducer TonB [Gemmatimonadetes bacterium]|nr:energy transducer TonB [Gemmatimonadota bacterium]